MTTLTNELTRKVLGVLLDRSEEAIPSVDLASITTSSLEALKAFVEGERRFRHGDYGAAIDHYESAVRQDSSFALAYARLSLARGWHGSGGARRALREAYELSGRLPEREGRVVYARYLRYNVGDYLAARDTLRKLTEAYPDDPSVWYHLGETLIHGFVPGGWPETERALKEATKLDPGVAPYHQHLMDAALSFHRDSAMTAQRIAAHSDGRIKEVYKVYQDLVFGAPPQRRAALARLDTLPLPDTQGPWWAWWPLRHPIDLDLQAQVLDTIRGRNDTDADNYTGPVAINRIRQGRVEEGLSILHNADALSSCQTAFIRGRGYPVPDSLIRPLLESSALEASPRRLLCSGIHAIEDGRGDELPRLIAQAEESIGTGGTLDSTTFKLWADELRGYRAFKSGNREKAARLWSGSKAYTLGAGALWRGDLYREMGRLVEAEAWYRAVWIEPVAHERMGRLYEKMNRPEDAIDAYQRFIAAWKNSDPELQPRVEAARQRRRALTDALADTTAATAE